MTAGEPRPGLIEDMRPGRIREIVDGISAVFVPVSPRYEWHALHLPVGCDGLIAEEVARLLAERLDAAWFRCLSLGLDQWRSDDFKRQNGLPVRRQVFGMNFPKLFLKSEYIDLNPFRAVVAARLDAIRGTGFRCAFIVNHHGGEGQDETLRQLAAAFTEGEFRVEVLRPFAFNTYEPPEEQRMQLRVGGHAGLAETVQLLAFRPDLVDLSQIPDGPLRAAEQGILHREPVIPAEWNPRRALRSVADACRRSVLDNLEAHVRKVVSAPLTP
jgi:creatinine amidohydrolase/Fe(II)-dependent formamide hydrolase-like protein